ncbi:Glycosyl transferase family 2 [Quadrisphaera granulorum]|uniref:Glycosyl transferase family 2 n=1 Tax=Quadrisphaera granulorum TaxID=317664 RepID=A0A315ZM84_9ACTN|nr:glycosyl transferase family 2 [Quadrisphaera granulorum]SZE99109.1 Glycosyl transferase family 2 [Quadrisphaera granulorum]
MVTHNGERYLEAQLESIVHQTFPVDGVHIFDDQSSDKTWDILLSYRSAYPEIFTIHRLPGLTHAKTIPARIGANFSYALNQTREQYDYIFLSDQDDCWLPNRVESQLQIFTLNPRIEVIAAGATLIGEKGTPIGRTLQELFPAHPEWHDLSPAARLRYILANPFATGATMAVAGRHLKRTLPIPPGWLHDRWLSVHSVVSGQFHFQPEPVIAYRIHEGQSVGAMNLRSASRTAWVAGRVPTALSTAKQVIDLRGLQAESTDVEVQKELQVTKIIKTYLTRATR